MTNLNIQVDRPTDEDDQDAVTQLIGLAVQADGVPPARFPAKKKLQAGAQARARWRDSLRAQIAIRP